MYIDARGLDVLDLMKKLKELFDSSRGKDVNIEILIEKETDKKKIKSFVAMSGCRATIEEKEDRCIIIVRGIPCCT
jgi:hypothetical protein